MESSYFFKKIMNLFLVGLLLILLPACLWAIKIDPSQDYSIGTGIYDITGPVVDEEMVCSSYSTSPIHFC